MGFLDCVLVSSSGMFTLVQERINGQHRQNWTVVGVATVDLESEYNFYCHYNISNNTRGPFLYWFRRGPLSLPRHNIVFIQDYYVGTMVWKDGWIAGNLGIYGCKDSISGKFVDLNITSGE